jgi:hypothetical protein
VSVLDLKFDDGLQRRVQLYCAVPSWTLADEAELLKLTGLRIAREIVRVRRKRDSTGETETIIIVICREWSLMPESMWTGIAVLCTSHEHFNSSINLQNSRPVTFLRTASSSSASLLFHFQVFPCVSPSIHQNPAKKQLTKDANSLHPKASVTVTEPKLSTIWTTKPTPALLLQPTSLGNCPSPHLLFLNQEAEFWSLRSIPNSPL